MVHSGRFPPGVDRRLNKYAGTILIGGIFLCFSVMMYLTFCNMPCEDKTYGIFQEDLELVKSHSYWKKHIFAAKKSEAASVIIMVLSGPRNLERRDVIRETWLSNLPKDVMVKFVIGFKKLNKNDLRDVERENSVHKDLLLLKNVEESYGGLTAKVLESFQWVDKNVDFQFLLKVDDDSFVHLETFLEELSFQPKERLYWGFFNGAARVKHTGKWKEKHWVLCDRYLPYARGGGYVLSADLVHYITINSKFLQQFNSEDVSVGAWLGPLDILRVHDPRFDTEFESRGCNNKYMVLHKKSPANMREKFNTLKDTGVLCRKEERKRLSYQYNWNVPPSLCCIRNDSTIP